MNVLLKIFEVIISFFEWADKMIKEILEKGIVCILSATSVVTLVIRTTLVFLLWIYIHSMAKTLRTKLDEIRVLRSKQKQKNAYTGTKVNTNNKKYTRAATLVCFFCTEVQI